MNIFGCRHKWSRWFVGGIGWEAPHNLIQERTCLKCGKLQQNTCGKCYRSGAGDVCGAHTKEGFNEGVIEATKGSWTATRVQLPDGTEKWYASPAKPPKVTNA